MASNGGSGIDAAIAAPVVAFAVAPESADEGQGGAIGAIEVTPAAAWRWAVWAVCARRERLESVALSRVEM